MAEALKCAYCHEEITDKPVEWGGKQYCCEACAFEASLKIGSICGSSHTIAAGIRFRTKEPKNKGS